MPHHRALIPRLAIFLAAATITVGAACRDSLTAPHIRDDLRSSPVISAPGDSGAPETIFLAPLGPRHAPKGELDTTLSPSVVICKLQGDRCGADTLVRFSSDPAAPDPAAPDPERVRLTNKTYAVTWDMSTIPADTITAYRVVVSLDETTVGYTDVKVVRTGYQPPPGDTARFAFLSGRRELDVQFQIYMPAVLLTVVTEPGVHGTLPSGTTTRRYGERVAYQFQADSGYNNLLVTVGQQYLPARGRLSMNGSLVLIVSADVIASVAPGDEWMVTEGRALLRSTNPVRDAQLYLDRLAALTDTTNIAARLARAARVLGTSDPSSLRALDAALAGHALSAGVGRGTEVRPPTPPSDPGGMTSTNLLPGVAAHPTLLPSRSMGIFTRSRYEPLVIAYVNGVLTTPFEALFNADAVARMARESNWTVGVAFEVRLIYNSTAVINGNDPSNACVLELARRSEGLGINTFPEFLKQCTKGLSPPGTIAQAFATLADFAEAGMQLNSILDRSVLNHPADADSVAAITARWMAAGQHVVFVAHSQGNLMVQQGVDILRRRGGFHPATDSTCIGAVSLAAPTSDNWPISSRHMAGLVAAHDAILLVGKNHFPQIPTPLGDSAEAESRRWRGFGSIPAMLGATRIKWLVRIHALERGYLGQQIMRTRIQTELVHAYKSCALGEVAITPQRLTITPTTSGAFSFQLLDLNADPLDGRRTTTWSGDADNDRERGVQVHPEGRVQARYVGGTAARLTTSTIIATAAVVVEPTRIPVAVIEKLTAKWALIYGSMTGPPDPEIPTGPPHTADDFPVTATTWDGGSCVAKQRMSPAQGYIGEYSKQCSAAYEVKLDPVPNAFTYEASFFARDHTDRLFSLTSTTPYITTELIAPLATQDPLPGPTLLDRVNVNAWDHAGHLLASGTGCAHGCSGWPGSP